MAPPNPVASRSLKSNAELIAEPSIMAEARDVLARELCSIYEDHCRSLLQYARSVGRSAATAQDVVQEAMLRYHASRTAGVVIENPRAWLYKVVLNLLIDLSAESTVPIEAAAQSIDHGHDPQAEAEAASLRATLARVLSPREFECVRLRAEGLTYDEIGSALKIRTGSVGALLARSVWKLKKEGVK
jgi:RNA polymerase sigma-70 factor (ECF subfamily)